MNHDKATILLVEDDPADARLIRRTLAGADESSWRVEWEPTLAAALERLRQEAVDIVLLDLTLPDGHGVETIGRILQAAPAALVVALGAASDEEGARQAVRRGAHDYLAKDRVDAEWWPRTLRHLIVRQAALEAQRLAEARFQAISATCPLGIFVADAKGACAYTNAAYHGISGLTPEQALEGQWASAIHPEDRERVLAQWNDAVRNRAPFGAEFRFLHEDGKVVWARVHAVELPDGAAERGYVQTFEDITGDKATQFMLRAMGDALPDEMRQAPAAGGDAVLTADARGRLSYMNRAAEKMTGSPRDQALGLPIAEVLRIIDASGRESAVNSMDRALLEGKTVGPAMNNMLLGRDGGELAIEDACAPLRDRDGRVTGAVIVCHDASEDRAVTQRLPLLAQHDFLTGLPNRVLLADRLSQAIRVAQRQGRQLALLHVDLDYFRHINESLGHDIGDKLLCSVATRLVACVRAADTVSRHGGDEFVILLADIEQPQDAAHIAEKLFVAVAAPHFIDGHEIHVSLSIGIGIYPDDGRTMEAVMQNADTAMYYAKELGRNNYQFFKGDMNARAVQRMVVENNLRRAVQENEFVLHYQPKINFVSGAMTGSEVLIRWYHPTLGLVLPAQFMAIAQECGLIVPIGQWVLREACRQVRTWLDAGLTAVPVAVNISAVEFRSKGFVDGLDLILKETGVPPQYLELELTESLLMHDAASSAVVLKALKSLGVALAIDDFGTGYSSLSYLKSVPIDALKIDQSFVHDLLTNADNATIVSAAIGMGKNLNQRVIAEGVETMEQFEFLEARECEEGQGFLFSDPLNAADFAQLLTARPVA